MTLIITIFGGFSFLASILTVAACMLSSRISQEEEGLEHQPELAANTLPRRPLIDTAS